MDSYFPHSTSTSTAPTVNEILEAYRRAFEKQLSDGTIRHMVFPQRLLGLFLVTAYLCIPHKEHPIIYAARWPLLALVTWFEWRMIWVTSGVGLGLGYPSGLLSAYAIMLSWTWLVFMRPQWDARRIQRVQVRSVADTKTLVSNKQSSSSGVLRQRNPVNRSNQESKIDLNETRTDDAINEVYFWQSYPEKLKDRIPWVFDLLYNFRGPGWNWAISSIPSPPPEILRELGGPVPDSSYANASTVGLKRSTTRYELIISILPGYLLGILTLDVLMNIMMKDPYFKFGPTTYALPIYLRGLPPSLLQLNRSFLAASAIMAGITVFFARESIISSCLLGPRVFGQRAEPWYYPTVWGYFSNILQKGLGGFWGDFWHQTFRFHFTAPTRYLIQQGYIKPGSPVAKATSLFFAFGLSGFLHAAGSVSTFAHTHPSHLILFFLLQSFGIVFQRAVCTMFSTSIRRLPKFTRQSGNLLFTLIWLYLTAWICVDDFARGGLWLLDPVAFSLIRVLGFGEHDANWFCCKGSSIKWHKGRNWWQSGIVVL